MCSVLKVSASAWCSVIEILPRERSCSDFNLTGIGLIRAKTYQGGREPARPITSKLPSEGFPYKPGKDEPKSHLPPW